MAQSNHSPVQRQLSRVSRRLFVQVFLDSLFWCLAGALALAAVWFLVQPLLLSEPPVWLRWTVAGGLAVAGTALAVLLAFVRRPSDLTAALSLDEKFNLRERVTTSLTLTPHQTNTPAAQALLEDVNQQVGKLDVGSRFPVRVSWNAALLPLCAAIVALVALFYEPVFEKPQAPAAPSGDKVPNADEIEKKIAQAKLEKKAREKQEGDKAEKSDDLKKFDEDMERIFGKPRENKDQIGKRVEEMTALKKEMNEHKKDLGDKSQALKEQLKQAERLAKQQEGKDGPAKELEKALKQGDMQKAKEEIERLAKKLQDKELTKEEQQKLNEQLQEIKEKMERLTRPEEEEEKLQELHRKGEIDQETLNRELEQLRKNTQKLQEDLKDLEEIAEQLAQCQKCMKEGDADGAAKAMRRAAGKMNKLDKSEDLEQLARSMEQLDEIEKMMRRGMRSGDSPPGDNPTPASGRRPEELDETGNQKTRITSDPDPKGKKEIVGTAPGSNFRVPRKPEDLVVEIKQASQEAPEALDRQRIPRAAGDIAKGYFENLGGQKEPPKKGAKP